MKKILILSISVISLFFITDNVNALSMNINNEEIEVTEENFIYYLYSQYKENFDTYPNYFLFKTNKEYKIYFTNSTFAFSLGTFELGYDPSTYSYCMLSFSSSTFSKNSSKCEENKTSRTKVSIYSGDVLLVTNTLEGSHSSVSANNIITKEDLQNYTAIKNKYKITYYLNDEIYQEIEVEEGSSHTLLNYEYNKNLYNFSGWTVENNSNLENITNDVTIKATLLEKDVITVYVKNFPEEQVTKTEFYTLLILQSVLIMLIFLKWCFPFKGGKDLK